MDNNILDEILPEITTVTRWQRLKSLIFDYFSLVLIMIIFVTPILGVIWLIERYTTYGCMNLYFAYVLSLMLNKDLLNGMSLGKRKVGLQIVNIRTNETASSLKCALRNSLIFIWPFEILTLLFYPERRLGDLIAGTKVILHPTVTLNETKDELIYSNKKQLFISFVIVFTIALLLMCLLTFIFPNGDTHVILKNRTI